ncbi:MAG: hypothetical protein KDC84_06970 [Crocinitomicaceae bacterium]|nr:hypothetical protein [Crocinitomicaceae bacterium]
MIPTVKPVLYANRLKETRKVFLGDDDAVYFETGLDNSFYKACYAYILCKHFGIATPEIRKVNKDGIVIYCQQTFSEWEEFDQTQNFSFNSKRRVGMLKNPIRILRLALFDEQFMVRRDYELGYNLALIRGKKSEIISKDFYQILDAGFSKGDSIQKALFFKNILAHFSLEEIVQEIDNYFSLQDELIEEKILLLSAYLKESKYKELYLGFINNESRNDEIRNQLLKNIYLLKR